MSYLICEICKSDDIEIKKWVNPNTNEIGDTTSDGEMQDNYCNNCQAHTEFIMTNDIKEVELEQKLDSIEAEFIQHFEDYEILDKWDIKYLSKINPDNNIEEQNNNDFVKWFYFFQGKYQGIKELLDKLKII